MACMGPIPPTDAYVDKVTNEVLEMFKTEHKVFAFGEPDIAPMKEARYQCVEGLREAIREVLWQEACESF